MVPQYLWSTSRAKKWGSYGEERQLEGHEEITYENQRGGEKRIQSGENIDQLWF
jgi:hypothetical protein